MDFDLIFEFIGKIVAVGGGAVAIAYAAFIYFGKSWLENRFKETLEAYKHEQRKELEQLRYQINSQLNRVTKIHEKEIEVLPEAFRLAQNAIAYLTSLVNPTSRSVNLENISDVKMDLFLSQYDFDDCEISKIKQADDKNAKFYDLSFWHDLNHARTEARKFHTYFQKHRIFLKPDLKRAFTSIDDLIWKTMMDREFEHIDKDYLAERGTFLDIRNQILSIMENIESLVQDRLKHDEA